RGPGATNASAGVHIGHQDSTPMILLIGQVARGMIEREAFQEIDYRRMFGQMAKWVAQIDDASRIPEFLHRAFMCATSGRPGPVVLALPEDMLTDLAAAADGIPFQQVESAPDPNSMTILRDKLSTAARPLLVLGGGGWAQEGIDAIRRFAEANELPVAAAFRRQDYLDNRHRCYAGDIGIGPNPKLIERLNQADLLIVVGARLGEMTTTGYTLLGLPHTHQNLVHIHNDSEELGRVYQSELAIPSGLNAASLALAELEPIASPAWAGQADRAHRDYLSYVEPSPQNTSGGVDMRTVMALLREHLPPDTIVTNGAGNYSGWLNRFWLHEGFRSQLAPTSGSMGYGFPAAIAACLVEKRRQVVCFSGDGCFLMTGQEMATAVQYDLNLLVILVNNSMYGTIRMHQEREYPARISGTDLKNPDFVALAHAYGAEAWQAATTEDFEASFAEALTRTGPRLIEIILDPEIITTKTTLTKIRENSLASRH
ncbi:MAG: thiamine pyrophosphate-dependent enzyme, partial [Pseudomonadota bacterium]